MQSLQSLQPQADEAREQGYECVASALVVNPEGKIFVQKRSMDRRLFPGCWDIVGGHVEEGETLEDCLKREVTEETGWTLLKVLHFVNMYEWGDEGDLHHEFMFLVEVEGDLTAPQLEEGKVTEFRWITPEETDILHENREPYEDVSCHRMVTEGFAVLEEA